jgi:hypothetical protein
MTVHASAYAGAAGATKGWLAAAVGALAAAHADWRRAVEATGLFEEMSALEDDALRARGLAREDLPRHVFESVFAD